MRRPAFIARQSGKPTGLVGRVIAAIMERETVRENEAALDLLDLAPTDHVLDLGCGHGRTLPALASRLPRGTVTGLDHSAVMIDRARRRCRDLVAAGRVVLRCGDGAQLPFEEGAFDKVLSVHTIYFWPDPLAQLHAIRRVLRAGGSLVLGLRFASAAAVRSFPASVYRFYTEEQVRTLLEGAGFVDVSCSATQGLRDGVSLLHAVRAA